MKSRNEMSAIRKKLSGASYEKGKQVSQGLLYDAIVARVHTWEIALASLIRVNHPKAVLAIEGMLTDENIDEIVTLFMHPDASTRNAVAEAFYRKHENNGFSQAALSALQAGLVARYPISSRDATAVVAGKASLSEILYPFVMRPAERLHAPHLQEFVQEPDCRVTAAHVSAWIYRENGRVSDVVLAGHANLPVCKEVSAKLATARMRLKTQPAHGMLVTGGAMLTATDRVRRRPDKQLRKPQDKPPLEDLVDQLLEVQKYTGMIKIYDAGKHTYTSLQEDLYAVIQRGMKKQLPNRIQPEPLEKDSPAIFMPFYKLAGEKDDIISVDLKRSDFGPEFEDLLTLHQYEYYGEMIADVKYRKLIYEYWLLGDMEGLEFHVREMFETLERTAKMKDARLRADEYVDLLTNQQHQILPWSPDQRLEERHMLMQIRAQALYDFMTRDPGAPRRSLKQAGQRQHSLPASFRKALEIIQQPRIEVRGARNYADVTTHVDGRAFYLSLQEMVEWNIPSMIRSDKRWIKMMDKILDDIDDSDPKRKKQIEAQNLEIFVDSFLRGWPAVFLPLKEQQERYERWQDRQREPVWRKIQEALLAQGVRMAPLQEDNVVFSVQQLDADTLRITPYYLTTHNSLAILLDPQIGIPHYLNPWQHRSSEIIQFKKKEQKRQAYVDTMGTAKEKLHLGETTAAIERFKEAMRLYPVPATERMLTDFWHETTLDTAERFKDFSELVTVMYAPSRHPKLYADTLEHFIEKYPNFLPDPYLLLGFGEYKETNTYFEEQSRLLEQEQAYQQQINDLVDDGILIPNADSKGSYSILSVANGIQDDLNQNQQALKEKRAILREYQRNLWQLIRENPNARIKQAMMLDSRYVGRVLQTGQISFSNNYQRYVAPLYGVLRGQIFMEMREKIVDIVPVGKDLPDIMTGWYMGKREKTLDELLSLKDHVSENAYITPNDLKPLNDLIEFLEKLQDVDSLTRENIVPQQFRHVLSELSLQAYKAYQAAGNTVLGLTEIPRWLMDSYSLRINYLNSFNTLLGVEKVVLLNGYPALTWEILNSDPLDIVSLDFRRESQQVIVHTRLGKDVPVLQLGGLSEDEKNILQKEVSEPNFAKKVQASTLMPAYAILYTPIAAPKRTQAWRTVIRALKPWFIHSFAHFSTLPLVGKEIEQEKVFERFDEYEVVRAIEVDMNALLDETNS